MSSFAFKKASDLVSSLSEHLNSQDLKLINKGEDFRQLFDVFDSGIEIHSNTQGEMIRVYSPHEDRRNGGFYLSMDHDLDRIMVLAASLDHEEMLSLIKNWKEVKNFLSLISGG
jgi:hypothetical protein